LQYSKRQGGLSVEVKDNIALENIKMIQDDVSGIYVKPLEGAYDHEMLESRQYFSYAEHYLCIHINLLSKYRHNIKKHLVPIFETILRNELEELDKKIK
jgi:hypothetical protein